nr:MAG TPA: hypothetical protein [Caudoviricetes sp.]
MFLFSGVCCLSECLQGRCDVQGSVVSRSVLSTIGLSLQAVLLITMQALHLRELFYCRLYQVCQRALPYRWRCCCPSFTLQRYRKFLNEQACFRRFLCGCM